MHATPARRAVAGRSRRAPRRCGSGPLSLPGLRGVEHVGLTVPDLDAAVRFFVETLGCVPVMAELSLDAGADGLVAMLDVDPVACARLRFLRCGHGTNLELFEYEAPDQATRLPRNSDHGGHHLAFYVDDMGAAVAWLRARGVEVMGEPERVAEGPSAGTSWVYFRAPWGLQLELVSYPAGKAYERQPGVRLWHPRWPER